MNFSYLITDKSLNLIYSILDKAAHEKPVHCLTVAVSDYAIQFGRQNTSFTMTYLAAF